MRMWMIKPRLLCNQHLVGEHGELHKHLSSLKEGYDLTKRFIGGQISPTDYVKRHDNLAKEIQKRADARGDLNGGHKSPMNEDINDLFKNCTLDYVDYREGVVRKKGSTDWKYFTVMPDELKTNNLVLLILRCDNCRKRIEPFIEKQDIHRFVDDYSSPFIKCVS